MKSLGRIVILAMVAAVAAAWFVVQWGFCRFYVPPGYMAILTARFGAPLDPGQILARENQRGVREAVLGEGRHFRNPLLYDWRIVPVVDISAGKVGIVTSKVGDELPEGEFLAEPGQKGIWRRVLGPGRYRMNPVGYQVDIVDAVLIPIGYDGVLTSLSGQQAPEGAFAKTGEKGVRADVLQPGLYYINTKEFQVDIFEIGLNQVSLLGRGGEVKTKTVLDTQNTAIQSLQKAQIDSQLSNRAEYFAEQNREGKALLSRSAEAAKTEKLRTRALAPQKPGALALSGSFDEGGGPIPQGTSFVLNQFVSFPSKDGFDISLDMTVEFELLPEDVAWLFRAYGDLPAVMDKMIMPQILSVSRLKGSAYGARDFIVGEGREKFQNDLTEALGRVLKERNVTIHSALIRHVNVPMQILEPIQQASVAMEMDLTNREQQNTARKMAELNTELSLISQRGEQVAQETEKLQAEILADQEKQVARIQAEAVRQVAQIAKETAIVKGERTKQLGMADAERVRRIEGERARGYQLRVDAFGDSAAFSLWTLAESLDPKLTIHILHSGEGTLWTDMEKARMGDLGGAKTIKK